MTDLDADAIVGAAFLLATLATPPQTAATALSGSAVGQFDLKRIGRLFVLVRAAADPGLMLL